MAAAWLSKHVGYLQFLYRLEIRVKYLTIQPSETLKKYIIQFAILLAEFWEKIVERTVSSLRVIRV